MRSLTICLPVIFNYACWAFIVSSFALSVHLPFALTINKALRVCSECVNMRWYFFSNLSLIRVFLLFSYGESSVLWTCYLTKLIKFNITMHLLWHYNISRHVYNIPIDCCLKRSKQNIKHNMCCIITHNEFAGVTLYSVMVQECVSINLYFHRKCDKRINWTHSGIPILSDRFGNCLTLIYNNSKRKVVK